MPSDAVTLQVNLTPGDLRHAREILPHQLRQVGRQVDHVELDVDPYAPRADDAAFRAWLDAVRDLHPRLTVRAVDDSDDAVRRVSALYGGRVPPRVDFRGRPIYGYLEPLLAAPTDWVLHLDSDMLLGGGSPTWVREAQELVASDPRYVLGSPYPGPPRADLRVLRQPGAAYVEGRPAVEIPNMSCRVFLVHVPTFVERLAPLPLLSAPLKGRLWTLRQPNPPYQKVELAVTARMVERGLRRVDLLGAAPGMWSLHPPYRSKEFYARLPELVRRVETGDLPAGQLGDFDLNDSVIDWSGARRAIRRERVRAMVLGDRA